MSLRQVFGGALKNFDWGSEAIEIGKADFEQVGHAAGPSGDEPWFDMFAKEFVEGVTNFVAREFALEAMSADGFADAAHAIGVSDVKGLGGIATSLAVVGE